MGELIKYDRVQWEKLKALALDSVTSPQSRRAYGSALDGFFAWYYAEPRPPLSKAVVNAYRTQLETAGLSASTINVRPSALRKLVSEAADNGLIAPPSETLHIANANPGYRELFPSLQTSLLRPGIVRRWWRANEEQALSWAARWKLPWREDGRPANFWLTFLLLACKLHS